MTTIGTGRIGRGPYTVTSAIAARSIEVVTIRRGPRAPQIRRESAM